MGNCLVPRVKDSGGEQWQGKSLRKVASKESVLTFPSDSSVGTTSPLVEPPRCPDSVIRSDSESESSTDVPEEDEPPPVRKLAMQKVSAMCNNFSIQRLIGEGSFGKVYEGHSEELGDVAIKLLDDPEDGRGLSWGDWVAEIQLQRQLRHPNILRLVAFSVGRGSLCQLSPLMPNGSLASALFGSGGSAAGSQRRRPSTVTKPRHRAQPMPWERRLRVAAQVADAVAFLHSREVVHRNLKPSNVLLDEDWHAYVADFSMAREMQGFSEVSTKLMGCLGYLDPAYLETGRLAPSSDVYSFGMMLLEVLTGRQAKAEGEVPLLMWAWPILSEGTQPDVEALLDPTARACAERDVALWIAKAAKKCLNADGNARPTMRELAEKLNMAVLKQSRAASDGQRT